MNRMPTLACLLAASCMSLGGCLLATSSSTYETGRLVSSNTLSRVEIGKTTESWLLGTLGEPSSRATVNEANPKVEILRYDYTKREESGGALFLIFAGSSTKSTTNSTWFEVTDGVVTNHGTDK